MVFLLSRLSVVGVTLIDKKTKSYHYSVVCVAVSAVI